MESTIVGIRANDLPVIIDSLGENINTSGHIDTGESAVVQEEAVSSGKPPAGGRSHESTDDLAAVIDRGDAGGLGARKIREGGESAVVQ